MARMLTIAFAALLMTPVAGRAQAPVFSGPQAGEKLPPFKVRGVLDADAGKQFDFVTQAAGKPIVLVFIHDINRPALKLVRTLTLYTAGRAGEGLATGVILPTDDVNEGEKRLKLCFVERAIALAREAPLGLYEGGKEGPGTYGLNRTVQLTILVGKDNKVTANFALVQPSIPADLPRILEAIAQVAGGPVPKVNHLIVAEILGYQSALVQDLFRRVTQKSASLEAVDRAAIALEEYVARDKNARYDIGGITRRLVEGGALADFGTPRAQEYLGKWAIEYGGARAKVPGSERKKP